MRIEVMDTTINGAVFRKIAAISGVVQGSSWLILSLLCIIFYYDTPEDIKNFDPVLASYEQYLSYGIFQNYLDKDVNDFKTIMRPLDFHIFMWFHFILSAIWLGLSAHECNVLFRKLQNQHIPYVTMASGILTILISILDLILFGLLLREYTTIDSTNVDVLIIYKTIIGIVMTLAMRGYTLWAFNVASGIVLISIAEQILRAPPILTYNNESIPRPKMLNYGPKLHQSNPEPVFLGDNDSFSNFYPAQSFPNKQNRGPPRPPKPMHNRNNMYFN